MSFWLWQNGGLMKWKGHVQLFSCMHIQFTCSELCGKPYKLSTTIIIIRTFMGNLAGAQNVIQIGERFCNHNQLTKSVFPERMAHLAVQSKETQGKLYSLEIIKDQQTGHANVNLTIPLRACNWKPWKEKQLQLFHEINNPSNN